MKRETAPRTEAPSVVTHAAFHFSFSRSALLNDEKNVFASQWLSELAILFSWRGACDRPRYIALYNTFSFMTRAIPFIALSTLAVMAFSADKNHVSGTVEVPALVYWASLGRTETVRRLLVEKGNPNAVDTGGWSALQAAAENGHLDIVKLLVAAGADVDYASANGTALQVAVGAKQDAVAGFLRSVGAK